MSTTYDGRPCKNCGMTKKYSANWTCVNCSHARKRASIASDPADNKERCRRYYRENKEKCRASNNKWASENRDRLAAAAKLWRAENAEKLRVHRRVWVERNRGKSLAIRRAVQSRREASKIMATPKWADMSEILRFYENTPPGHHVDHIVPLRGRNVCGLHVLDNLQYLPASENVSKGNRFAQ